MKWYWVLLVVAAIALAATLLFLITIYFMCFFNTVKNKQSVRAPLSGEQYAPFEEETRALIKRAESIAFEDAWITAFDNKKLHARVKIQDPSKPFVIMAHGYKGDSLRDFAGGLGFYLDEGYNTILIDHRAHGLSDGRTITFGIKERKDILSWIDYTIRTYGAETKIIVTGISMGGATVLMALDQELPKNVKCVISDCPFSSPLGIILKVVKDMHLSAKLTKPFVKICARLLGRFNIEESSALEAIKHTFLPILIIHGTDDRYVPCGMSEDLAKANPNVKLVEIKGAPHGLSFLVDNEKYISEAKEFLRKNV